MAEETMKSLEQFQLVVPAKELFEALSKSTDADSVTEMTPERARNMKLVLGFLNAYIRAFGTKMGYFRLVGVTDKLAAAAKYSKRLK